MIRNEPFVSFTSFKVSHIIYFLSFFLHLKLTESVIKAQLTKGKSEILLRLDEFDGYVKSKHARHYGIKWHDSLRFSRVSSVHVS